MSSSKTDTEVIIGGKVFTLSGYESEEYLQKVASYINNKITELNSMDGFSRLNSDDQFTLMALNMADDLFKEKSNNSDVEKQSENKDKEIFDLKHELISLQIKTDEYEKTIKSLESEIKELQLNKARLETSLEDVLLGKTKGTGKNN